MQVAGIAWDMIDPKHNNIQIKMLWGPAECLHHISH